MCALIAIVGSSDAAAEAVEALHMQQHRGREASGVASADGSGVYLLGGLGLVGDVFPETVDVPRLLPGHFAIGHNRYSTVTKDARNAALYQPIRGKYGDQSFCLAHNGNITNTKELWNLVDRSKAKSSVDSELITLLIEHFYTGDFDNDLANVLCRLRGTFCLLILFRNRLVAVRDPSGNRPLSIGFREGGTVVIASETSTFETLGVYGAGDIEPGNVYVIDNATTISQRTFASKQEKTCIFERVYFEGPTSDTVTDFRIKIGETLEQEHPAQADMVVGVPDSGLILAIGYGRSGRSGLLYPGIIRHHNAGGRTFILPEQNYREAAVRRKFMISVDGIRGKRIALIDDSIVRGTTMKIIVERLRRAGASEIHVRSAFPPIAYPCIYGIDTPTTDELIAANSSVEHIRQIIGADSLAFMNKDSLLRTAGGNPTRWCTACITGKYEIAA